MILQVVCVAFHLAYAFLRLDIPGVSIVVPSGGVDVVSLNHIHNTNINTYTYTLCLYIWFLLLKKTLLILAALIVFMYLFLGGCTGNGFKQQNKTHRVVCCEAVHFSERRGAPSNATYLRDGDIYAAARSCTAAATAFDSCENIFPVPATHFLV